MHLRCVRLSVLCAAILLALAATGCRAPYKGASYMHAKGQAPPSQPPPGKSLVVFHRPAAVIAGGLNFSVWDSHKFVGHTFQGKQGIWYVTEPGEHTFVGRCEQAGDHGSVYFGEKASAIKATLATDKTYDVYCQAIWHFLAHEIKLRPVLREDADLRRKIPSWIEKQRWLEMRQIPEAELTLFESQERQLVDVAIASAKKLAAEGDLPALGPEDCR